MTVCPTSMKVFHIHKQQSSQCFCASSVLVITVLTELQFIEQVHVLGAVLSHLHLLPYLLPTQPFKVDSTIPFRNEKQKARLARSHHKEVAEWSSHPTCLRQSQGGPRMLATGTYCLGTGPRPHPINSRRHCTRVASLAPAGAGWPLYCSSII